MEGFEILSERNYTTKALRALTVLAEAPRGATCWRAGEGNTKRVKP
jgi:hypothetical protein